MNTMLHEYQRVRLIRPIPPLDKGAAGVVVMAYNDAEPPGYEVEFMDSSGVTLALLTLHENDLEPVEG